MNETSTTTDKEILLQAIRRWLEKQQQQQKQNIGDI